MREYIHIEILGNWVSMLRAEIEGAIWLADDDEEARFYERLAHPTARVVPAPSVALLVLDTVEARGVEGVVATVRGAEENPPARKNVFRPSLGDTASLLITSQACDRVLKDVGGAPWYAACVSDLGSIQSRAAYMARLLELIDRACVRENIPRLDAATFTELILWDLFELDWERVCLILGQSGLRADTLNQIQNTPRDEDAALHLLQCDGMNVVRVLASAIPRFRPRGLKAIQTIDAEKLAGMLRVAFDLYELENDEMFWQMRWWQRRNTRYGLLIEWRTLDPLGVVWDQRYWEGDLAHTLRILGATGRLAVLKMDLDDFGQVNRTLGHGPGDDAIRLFCRTVKKLSGDRGEVYRRGGDEIVVLCPELDSDAARQLSETIRATVELEFHAWCSQRGLNTCPTASIGLVLTSGSRPQAEIVRLLDDAQREAKNTGKNRVVCAE